MIKLLISNTLFNHKLNKLTNWKTKAEILFDRQIGSNQHNHVTEEKKGHVKSISHKIEQEYGMSN